MANQFLGLSLFIMLLSFFIVLNSVSDFEIKKSNPVLNSLSLAFSLDTPKQAPSEKAAAKTEEMRKGSSLDKMQGLFEAKITGVEASQNRLGTVMHMRLPYAEFEREITSSVLKNSGQDPLARQGFLPMLVSLLETKDSDEAYKMNMVVNLPISPAQALSEQNPEVFKTTKSLAAIALRLEKAGLPKKLITTGLKQGDEGMIDIFFRRYEPFNPFVGVNTEGAL